LLQRLGSFTSCSWVSALMSMCQFSLFYALLPGSCFFLRLSSGVSSHEHSHFSLFSALRLLHRWFFPGLFPGCLLSWQCPVLCVVCSAFLQLDLSELFRVSALMSMCQFSVLCSALATCRFSSPDCP
jgi:hypothetical protein